MTGVTGVIGRVPGLILDMDTMPEPTLWFLSRGAATVALVLLTASVVLGIMSAAGWNSRHWPRFASEWVHRSVSLMALTFVVIHVVTVVVHTGQHELWRDAVVPFGSQFRPLWVGLGVLALDCMVVLIVTGLLRRLIGHRVWRALHWSGYAAWSLAVVHALGSGTDVRAGWSMAITGGCLAAVVLAVLMRIANGWPGSRRRRLAALALTVSAITWLGFWAAGGPLAPNWALHAGTTTPAPVSTPRPAPVGPVLRKLNGLEIRSSVVTPSRRDTTAPARQRSDSQSRASTLVGVVRLHQQRTCE